MANSYSLQDNPVYSKSVFALVKPDQPSLTAMPAAFTLAWTSANVSDMLGRLVADSVKRVRFIGRLKHETLSMAETYSF
jgi:hypothetical protein